ncbi:uncharacterized protein LOC6558854 [Drosophila grimshawi]|uniref:GH16877 n=1 Tax=Drosophila grimshawi TaxID=7222 RepID=B4IXB7_DROGR|nr:uncharacterized protein LOC6558854 [Drosophila grimshawi]EDV97449.1 GH16877 [Drosophila grimshawi]
MSSQINAEMCGGKGSEATGAGAAAYMNSFSSEMSMKLELKSSPKQICIPPHQRHRMASSEMCVSTNRKDTEMPDKSWSVLYVGAKKDDNFE